MFDFVVKCRRTPVEPSRFLASVGREAHVEFIPAMIVNALFVANGHRENSRLHLVFEQSTDFSRILTFDGRDLGDLGGLSETMLLGSCADALSVGARLTKEAEARAASGIIVRATSFEKWVQVLTTDTPGYLLDPRGVPIQEMAPLARAVFILTDQLALPKNTQKGLIRKGVTSLSLGTQMLFASQCISVLHSRLTY